MIFIFDHTSSFGKSMDHLLLDPDEYPAGIAIWGGVEPIFMTAHRPSEEAGIHVHARKSPKAEKDIDQSFDEVTFRDHVARRDIRIDQDAAVGFMISQILGLPLLHVICTNCGNDIFLGRQSAAHPSTSHQCPSCLAVNITAEAVVANPLISLRERYSSKIDPAVVLPRRPLSLQWGQFPGGIDIWGSNQAIIWTAHKPEEEGLHIHWYASDGTMLRDDTFDTVAIGTTVIDVPAARLWMAQREVYQLRSAIRSINCEECDTPICDHGLQARTASRNHRCTKCARVTVSASPIIANPMPMIIQSLRTGWQLAQV